MKRTYLSIPLLLIVLVLVLAVGTACKKAPPPAPLAPVAVTPKKDAPAATVEADTEDQVETYSYVVPERNPFGSLLRVKKNLEPGEPGPELTPLQRIPVGDMKVESIIVSSKRSVAHLITPDGKAHIITVGTLLGRHDGKVVRIK